MLSSAMAFPQPDPGISLGTNTVFAAIPREMSLASAKRAFGKFGDLASIEMLPGSSRAVSVSYFDIRAAVVAMQALGGARYCRPGPQIGDRSLCVSGEFRLSHVDILGVSTVVSNCDGSCTVEFFDIRDAERVRSAFKSFEEEEGEEDEEQQAELERPPGLEHLAALPASSEACPEVKGLKDVTNMPQAKRSSLPHYCVLVHNMPNMLCTNACLEATLQQAGFQGAVAHFTTKPGKPCGEAIVWLKNKEAAEACIAHFQGRRWNGDNKVDKEVRAWLVSDRSMSDPWGPRERCDTGNSVSTVCPSDGEEDHGFSHAGACHTT